MILSILLFCLNANAASWLNIELNHFNQIYAAGERASFRVQALSYPKNPKFKLKVFALFAGNSTEVNLTEGVYFSPPLPAGIQRFRFVARLISLPPQAPYDEVMEDTAIDLTVNPLF